MLYPPLPDVLLRDPGANSVCVKPRLSVTSHVVYTAKSLVTIAETNDCVND